jgi:signal transduction histidine kinase
MVEALQKVNELEKQHSIQLAMVNNQLQKEITEKKQAEEQSRLLSRRLINVIEETRKNLARDLHDEFGQTLTALHMDLEALWSFIPPEMEAHQQKIDNIIVLIEQLGDKIRNISSELRPDLLDDLGLAPALEWNINEFSNQRHGIQINFQAVGVRKRFSSEIEIVVYRIFQEGLNNIVKHTKATQVDITLTYSHPKIIFMIKDNGAGFDPNAPTDGIGLLGMRERVASVKGNIEMHTVKDKGTTIRVELPVS